jgi:hypothetical protein
MGARDCEFESRSGRGVQHYVIMFVSDLRQEAYICALRHDTTESGVKHHNSAMWLYIT